jgi:ATP-dependent Clp protease adaptor protein ClpS
MNSIEKMPDSDLVVKERIKTRVIVPKFYAVLFHNDDYTPMDFVIQLLMELFNKPLDEAHALTMYVHKHGKGVAGLFTYEIANQKCAETLRVAAVYQHPLRVTVEES